MRILPRSKCAVLGLGVLITVGLGVVVNGQQALLPAVTFASIANFSGETWPADFNRDGITDLVGRNATSGAIQIALGNGDGTFKAPVASAASGWVLTAGDVNGDGKPDVVAKDDTGIFILAGAGTATLGAVHRVLDGADFTFAAIADVNNDGHRDLAIGEEPSSLHVFAGHGDFTFDPPVTLTTGDLPHAVIVTDLNNDGLRDIVVANALHASATIFRNTGGLTFATSDLIVNGYATGVTARDLNGDGKIDLVVASAAGKNGVSYFDGYANVFLGHGDGTFTFTERYQTAPGAFAVVVGDFTRDGRTDIATVNRSFQYVDDCTNSFKNVDSLSILPSNGDGTFGAATSFALQPQVNTWDGTPYQNIVSSLNTSDLNGDGQTDLIASDGKILLNAAPRANRPPVAFAGDDQHDPGDDTVVLYGGGTDPDGHFLTFHWTSSTGESIDSNPNPCRSGFSKTMHTFTLTVDDGHGGTASDTVNVDLTPVSTNTYFTAPRQGSRLQAGSPAPITWSSSDSGINTWQVSVSHDNSSWQPISSCTSLPASARQCVWSNPGPVDNSVYLQLTAYASDGSVVFSAYSGAFAVLPAGSNPLPDNWVDRDVGSVSAAGSAGFDGTTFTVTGSGADIWGTADAFNYADTTISGDFDFTARVASVQNVNAWTKAGLMVREGAYANARHVSLFATPSSTKGIALQQRYADGGASTNTSGPAIAPPYWLKVARRGTTIYAAYRKATTDPWTLMGSASTTLDYDVEVGLAVSSHVDGTVATAKFDHVVLEPAHFWRNQDIGAVGVAGGNVCCGNDPFRTAITGSGADIWGTADAFQFQYTQLYGDGSITARVLSVQNTNAWAKTGVMFRESTDPGARHVFAIVSAGKGVALQYRADTGGTTAQAAQISGAAPRWVRITRSGNIFTASTSTDGTTWTTLGSVTVAMSADIIVGLPITSHNNSTLATASLDDVSVR